MNYSNFQGGSAIKVFFFDFSLLPLKISIGTLALILADCVNTMYNPVVIVKGV
jgi:hypothetical protein